MIGDHAGETKRWRDAATDGEGVAAGATGLALAAVWCLKFQQLRNGDELESFRFQPVNVAGMAWMVCAWISWARTIDF